MVGSSISHYALQEELGRGGMGIVYRAEDTNLRRSVAIKVLPGRVSPKGEEADRLRREAQTAASLNHKNIATIHDLGETEDGQTFIVMEYVRGETLADRVGNGPLPVDQSVRIISEVVDGLVAAHEVGVVHRDIKPRNLILSDRSETKILDFGLATIAGASASGQGKARGTVAYMSPEQARGEKVDPRTDIWSVGVVLYEILTGVRPFDAPYDSAILYSIINAEPVRPRNHNAEIPPRLEEIVLKCLAKDREIRYSSAAELSAALGGLDGEVLYAKPDAGKRHRRRFAGIVLTAVALFVLLLAVPRLRYALLPGWRPLPEQQGLAVLPFINVGQDPTNTPLVDGLVHNVTAKIQGLERFRESLWVVPSSEVFAKEIETTEDAVSLLHVGMVVSGSVWIEADDIRLALYLVDARTGRTINSGTLSRSRANFATLQTGVVDQLAELLEIQLQPEQERRLTLGGTTSPGAFEFYVRASGYLARWDIPENVDLAIRQFQRSIGADPDYALAEAGLGEAFWRKFDGTRDPAWIDSAIVHSRKAIALNDELAPVHVVLGLIYQGRGEYELSEERFTRAIEIDDSHAPAWLGLGASLENQGRIDEAEVAYRTAVLRSPSNWNNYNKLGIFYFYQNRYDLAAEQFRRVIDLAPDNAFGYNNLAVQYQRLGDMVMAESTYSRAARVSAGAVLARARALYNLGGIMYARGDFAGAAEKYRESLDLDDTYMKAWSDLGDSYHWLGNEPSARDAWHEALALAETEVAVNPSQSSSLELFAETYAKLGETKRSLDFVQRILALDQITSTAYRSLARTFEILGERSRALEYAGMALEAGHSVSSMEASKWLEDLRADPAYQSMLGRRIEEPEG